MWLTQNNTLRLIDNSTNPFTYPIVVTMPGSVNAVDINPGDGNLYGVRASDSALFRVNSAGTYTSLGTGSWPSANKGAFSNIPNILYVNGGGVFYAINVITLTGTLIPQTGGSIGGADIAWYNGFFWFIEGNGQLGRVSTTGAVTLIGAPAPELSFGTWGAMIGGSNGLFAANNSGGLYQIDTVNGGGVLLSGSPASGNNDGAHCNTQPVILAADLSVTKTNTPASGANDLASDSYTAGAARTYTIVVRNAGPFGAGQQQVRDTLPTGITAASYTCTASAGSNCGTAVSGSVSGVSQIDWTGIGLPVNGTVTILVTLTVPASYTGNLVNTVTVLPSTSVIDANTANNTAVDSDTAAVVTADLSITKTNNLPGTVDLANDTVTRGQSTTYRIVVTNNGPIAVTGAVVTDTATGLTCTSLTCASSSGSSCPAAPTVAQLTGAGITLLALPVSGTLTLNLTCTVN